MRICGGLFFVLCFVSLSSAQRTHQWIARFSGTVFVTGSVTRPTTDIDIAIIKYSPDGVQLWVLYYPPKIVSGVDIPTAILVNTAHDGYVTDWSLGKEQSCF